MKKWCVRWFRHNFTQGGAAFDLKKEAEAYVIEKRKENGMYLVTEPKLEEFVDPFVGEGANPERRPGRP